MRGTSWDCILEFLVDLFPLQQSPILSTESDTPISKVNKAT